MSELSNIDILSVWGFIFFLLIFLIGYIFVEILLWKDYFFRSHLEIYGNHLFDRIIHYISWGIILNILYFYFNYFSWALEHVFKFLEISWEFWVWFKEIWDPLSIQFVVFSLFYFVTFLILLSIFTIIIKYPILWLIKFNKFLNSPDSDEFMKKIYWFFMSYKKKKK